MRNYAAVPIHPDPLPLTHFRGVPVTHTVAENIFIGHLEVPTVSTSTSKTADESLVTSADDKEVWSWKVVCGQNPAYDYFGCQHQIFYKDPLKPSIMWYDPVFQVRSR